MSNAIDEAIHELDGKITQLTTARDALLVIHPRSAVADSPTESAAPVKRTYQKRGLPPLDVRKTAKGGGKAKEEVRMPKAETTAAAAPVVKRGRKPAMAAPSTPVTVIPGEKPTTLAGAMKACAKTLKTFTRDQLCEALEADADFKELLENSSAAAMTFNLKYWSDRNRLKKEGSDADATYTVVDLDF